MRNLLSAIAASALLTACAALVPTTADLGHGQTGWIAYPSSFERLTLRGDLRFPAATDNCVPAMIIAHASGGLDGRNHRWAKFLQENGFATFEMDYFGPRGISANSKFQPMPVYDAYDALKLLATHPRIDPSRIGIIGFSRGADIALGSANASASFTSGHRFAAHVALYPGCGSATLAKGGSGAPILVMVGTRDDTTGVRSCERLIEEARAAERDARLIVYEGAYHGWDGDFSGVWFHPAINRSYAMYPDQSITEMSRRDVLAFLRRVMN